MDGAISCEICDKEFKNLRLLLNHQRCHIRINCPHCNKAITASNYEHHVRTIHACAPLNKRKATAKTDTIASKRKSNEKLPPPNSLKRKKTAQVKSYFILVLVLELIFMFGNMGETKINLMPFDFFLLNSDFRCKHRTERERNVCKYKWNTVPLFTLMNKILLSLLTVNTFLLFSIKF